MSIHSGAEFTAEGQIDTRQLYSYVRELVFRN